MPLGHNLGQDPNAMQIGLAHHRPAKTRLQTDPIKWEADISGLLEADTLALCPHPDTV